MTKSRILMIAAVLLTAGIGGFVFFNQNSTHADQQETQALAIPPPIQVEFQKDTLNVVRQDGQSLTFNVELATTAPQLTQGLMFRTEMAEDAGMLFLFKKEDILSFWMKNTLIPLDMLFIDADGQIVHIHENAIPQDLTPVPSQKPAKSVLELNGGIAKKMGIQVGDQIIHDFFGNTEAKR